jgi:hypothetical protein
MVLLLGCTFLLFGHCTKISFCVKNRAKMKTKEKFFEFFEKKWRIVGHYGEKLLPLHRSSLFTFSSKDVCVF